MSGALVR